MRPHRFALFAALTLVLGAMPGMADARHTPQTGLRTIAFAKVPPDFTFDTGAGPERLSSHFGKPVVLNFWATWCRPCLDELTIFTEMQQLYGSDATLITLSKEAPGTARGLLETLHLALPLAEDPTGEIFRAYSVQEVPVTIVLGRSGAVSYVSVGALDWDELHAAVDAALGQP